jgi:TRAP-type C4-dicarboxylate transport system permease small subunit
MKKFATKLPKPLSWTLFLIVYAVVLAIALLLMWLAFDVLPQ